MTPLKTKGDLAELKVACDLVERGYRVAIPFGEDCDFDLVFWRTPDRLERVQVKHATSDGKVIPVQCRSNSLTKGKVKRIKRYTARTIDWIAAPSCSTIRPSRLRTERVAHGPGRRCNRHAWVERYSRAMAPSKRQPGETRGDDECDERSPQREVHEAQNDEGEHDRCPMNRKPTTTPGGRRRVDPGWPRD